MRNIYEFIVIHIVFYVVAVNVDLKNQEFNAKDIYQTWMLLNMLLTSIFIITKKFTLFLVFLLQIYMYIYLRKYNPQYVQLATILIPIALTDQSSIIIVMNQIFGFLISGPENGSQQLIFLLLIILLTIFLYGKQHVEEILTKKKQKVDSDEKFLQELPFPLFIINVKSQIHWSNKLGRELVSNCGINANQYLKEVFQDQDLFLQYLSQNSEELIVQLNTVLIQKSLEQSQLLLQNKAAQQQQLQQPQDPKIAKIQQQKEDNLAKSHKYQNVGCLTLSSLKITEQIQKEILTVLIKPFKINQMRLYMICANTNKSFQQNQVLQNHLIQQIKQNGQQMLVSLQQDYQKWDNMRSLEIIRESDLKVISQSIVDLYKIIFEFETFEVSTCFFPQNNLINFQFKGLVTYLIEVFAGRYLQHFTSINLYFDNSIQDKMKGNSTNFSIIFMCILELIARYTNDKKPSLKINCNLDQVTDKNKAYQIQVQFLWRQNEKLDEIFKEFFHQQIMPLYVDQQVQRYLMTIKKLQIHSVMKIFYIEQTVEQIEQLSELHIFVDFYICDPEETNPVIYSPPQIQITFSRELVGQNPNEIIWQPKRQPQVIADKNHQLNFRQNKPPVFFNKQSLPINNEAKLQNKKELPEQDENVNLKKNQLIRDLIQSQFSKVAPRLSEKIAVLIKKKLKTKISQFQALNFVEEPDEQFNEDEEEQSNFNSSDENKGTSRRSMENEEDVSIATPMLDSVPGGKRPLAFPYQIETQVGADLKSSQTIIQTVDYQIDAFKKIKLDNKIEDLKQDKNDLVDLSQFVMNENFVTRIAEALDGNLTTKELKFIKCDFSDQLLIPILDAIAKSQVEILYLQHNLLQEKSLQHIINLKQSQSDYPLKKIYFSSNLVNEIKISKEKAILANLGIKVIID